MQFRHGAIEFLELASEIFDIVVYSHEFVENVQLFASIIEETCKRSIFTYVLGKEHLTCDKYRIRSQTMLKSIGVKVDRLVVLGTNHANFKLLEPIAIPVRKFSDLSELRPQD